MVSAAPTRYHGLDVLRGFAALTVVLAHYTEFTDHRIADLAFTVPNEYGYYAVQLFFTISGLVIFRTLEKCRSVWDFAYLRFSRLYPAYWASLCLVALLSATLFGETPWLGGLLVNATMFQEFLGYPNIDNVYWSLTAELAFYLHAAWLFALGWHRYVLTICAVWIAATLLWANGLQAGQEIERDGVVLLFDLDVSVFFVFGLCLYDVLRRGVRAATAVILAAAFVALWRIYGLEGVVVGVTVLALCTLATFDRLAVLVNRVTLWLGGISYSLYLVHRNLGYLLLPRLAEFGLGPVSSICVSVALALTLACLLTVLVERPALRSLRRARRRAR